MIIDNPSFYELDDKLKTGKINLDNVKGNDNLTIPIQIYNDTPYTVIQIDNIKGQEIFISKHLRNMYWGENITYVDTTSPLNFYRGYELYGLTHQKIIEIATDDFMDTCILVKKEILKSDLAFLETHLKMDLDLVRECKGIIEHAAYNSMLGQTVADIDLIKNIVIPFGNELRLCLSKKSYTEFEMLVDDLYMSKRCDMVSMKYWEKYRNELALSVKMHIRGNYEKI